MTHETPDNTDDPQLSVNFDTPEEETRSDAHEQSLSSPLAENAPLIAEGPPETWFRRLVFPGLEAVLWMVGTLIAMISGTVAVALVYRMGMSVTNPGVRFSFDELQQQLMLPGLIGSQVFLIGFAVLAVFLRFGPRFPETLGLRRLSIGHVLVVLGLTLPVNFLANAWSALASGLLDWAGISLSPQDYIDQMQQISSSGPVVVIWLLIAVSPALGEELIFRGLIGNVLVKKWGPVWGVTITSILFGIIHITPVQAIAVIPLGMAMHYVYLMTKSFWAPVLLHLANNSLALAMLKSAGDLSDAESQSLAEPLLAAIIGVAVLTAGCLFGILWQTRRQSASTSAIEVSDQTTAGASTTAGDGTFTTNPATPLTYLAAAVSLAGIGVLAYLTFAE